ncbi:MAG: hypothetical protein WCF23_00670 [Candidatus Nitrosopolaris sp.]
MSPALPGNLVAGVSGQEWLTSYVIDQLFIQMCDGPLVDHSCDVSTCDYVKQMSFHYIEAFNYARRISYGKFEGKNAKHRPVFTINARGFTTKLKEELKVANDAKSLHRIITESLFKIFKARHKLIFYEHIEPRKLSWNIINL